MNLRKQALVLFTCIIPVIAVWSSMAFEPPGPQDRLRAIGTTEGLPAVLARAFTPDDSFQPVPTPGPNDWLTAHREPGQTFEQFRRFAPNRPDARRRVIYLQPLVMNGSNHLQESDRRPLHLCPVCLRKLQFSVGFDVVKRYEDLARFDEQAGFEDEVQWLKRRVEKLRGDR